MCNRSIFYLFFIIIFSSCNSEEAFTPEPELRPVKFAKIINSDGSNSHSFAGVAQASDEANLSFRVAGNLRLLKVKLGDRVRKGDLIASIDPTDYQIQAEQAMASEKGTEANLKSAQTQIKAAETQLIAAKSAYERIEKLYENNSISLSDFDQAKATYETAQAQFEATQSSYLAAKTQVTSTNKQVEAAQNQIGYTRLIAPFNGIITDTFVDENELVGAGQPIVLISSESEPEVKVGIPESYISKIKENQDVTISFSVLGDENFKGIVSELSYASSSTATYPCIIKIKNPDKSIRPGMAATVKFSFNLEKSTKKNFLVCPVAAIAEDEIGNFVFKLNKVKEGVYKCNRQSVEVTKLLKDGFEIVEGLNEGDMVATAGIRTLLDGMQVKLMNPVN